MTPQLREQVERVFQAALAEAPDARAAFVAQACDGDPVVRSEVESLLAFASASGVADRTIDSATAPHRTPAAAVGRRLGVFEVGQLLGAGGMGEVYRARDTRLGRDVAIKILPDHFRKEPSRVARFEHEARVLASLNHPHIAAIYDVEEAGDRTALVMELVEGEELSQRGARRVPEALAIARQIAEALEAAHEQGIVHRDLKPANVKLRPDGTVKVLDFGLATALGAPEKGGPTLTRHTADGAIIGTPAYMSPEQARGEPVGTQADIWAFGVVLYELLTGVAPFARATKAQTLVSVLNDEPDDSRLPAETPQNVRHLIRRCLEKDRRRRLQHIGDARIELEETSAVRVQAPVAAKGRRASRALVAAATLAALAAGAVFFWGWSGREQPAPAESVRLTTMLPQGVSVLRSPLGPSVAVSPDGRTLVVAGEDRNGQRLYRRPLDRLDATVLGGTERGSSPFFSPDGEWIGFFADGRIKRIPATGGTAVDVVALSGLLRSARWGTDDRIYLTYGFDGLIYSVDAAGGVAEKLAGPTSAFNAEISSDARTTLFQSNGWIHALDRDTGRQTRLVEGLGPLYVDGYLLLKRGRTLLAAPIDLAAHKMLGPAVPVVDGVARDVGPSSGHYSVSAGTLAYVPAAAAYSLVLVRPDGTEQVVSAEQRSFENPQFSPDGRLVAVATTRREREPADVWIHALDTGTATRLTTDGGRAPVWTPDGSAITYSHLGKDAGIYVKRADGSGDAKRLVPLDAFHWLVGWTPDQRTLTYGMMEGTPSSIFAVNDNQSRRIVGPSAVWGGRLSPDGRLLVYSSSDSGNFEVYVTPFPDASPRWLVGDGSDPTWSPNGQDIYYRNGARLMAARVDTTAGARVLSRRVVVEPFLPPMYDDYAVHPDGRTLILVRPTGTTQAREVNVVVNWAQELRRVVARD